MRRDSGGGTNRCAGGCGALVYGYRCQACDLVARGCMTLAEAQEVVRRRAEAVREREARREEFRAATLARLEAKRARERLRYQTRHQLNPLFRPGTAEAAGRAKSLRSLMLTAQSLLDAEGSDGWIEFATWAQRLGYENCRRSSRHLGAASRRWERIAVYLRREEIETERGPRGESARMRFTVDGRDRLMALLGAYDKWLASRADLE